MPKPFTDSATPKQPAASEKSVPPKSSQASQQETPIGEPHSSGTKQALKPAAPLKKASMSKQTPDSKTQEPPQVQPSELDKIPQNAMVVIGMKSAGGELVPYSPSQEVIPAEAQGLVEQWLLRVESSMRSSLREALKFSMLDYKQRPRIKWLFDFPEQIIHATSSIFWTAEVTKVSLKISILTF